MGQSTEISWTDATWNPILGCNMVSPGCARCYAETMSKRLAAMATADIAIGKNPGRKRHYLNVVNDKGKWNGEIEQVPEAMKDPFKWKTPKKVFVNSMSDLFHDGVPFEYIDKVFAVMALNQRHTFQVLTKRPERMAEYVSRTRKSIEYLETPAREMGYSLRFEMPNGERVGLAPWPLPNVILGTSVEDQPRADERLPHLRSVRKAGWTTMVSYEPALGPVNWEPWSDAISWLVSGGESGHGARPSHPDWHRAARDFCVKHEISYHFKQWGEFEPIQESNGIIISTDRKRSATLFRDGSDSLTAEQSKVRLSQTKKHDQGTHALLYRVGKKAAGRLLDGVEHNGFPTMPEPAERA